nr:reverse transcriptase domain-containing protein [Tanacetum cinerariifolium]
CDTCGGPHTYNDCPATVGQIQNVYAAEAYNKGESKPKQSKSELPNRNQGNNHGNPPGNNQGRNQIFQGASHGQNPPPPYQAPAYQAIGTGSLPSNTIPNPREDLKIITTRGGVTLAEPSVSPSPSKEVDREPETITDQSSMNV